MEKVSYFISRYSIVEALFLSQRTESTDSLEKLLTEFYGAILLFLVRAQEYYERDTLGASNASMGIVSC